MLFSILPLVPVNDIYGLLESLQHANNAVSAASVNTSASQDVIKKQVLFTDMAQRQQQQQKLIYNINKKERSIQASDKHPKQVGRGNRRIGA